MITGDLDPERRLYRGDDDATHLDEDCRALEGDTHWVLAGWPAGDTEICGVCTGDAASDREWTDPIVLRHLYHTLDWTQERIAEVHRATASTVSYHFDRAGIETNHVAYAHDLPDDPEVLREKYHDEGMTMAEIGEEFGCSDGTVMRRLHEHGIEVRRSRKSGGEDRGWQSERVLHELYVRLGWGLSELADAFDVQPSTVKYHLDKHGIETGGAERNRDHGLDDPDHFRRLYHDLGLYLREIAERADVSRSTVRYWKQKHGIEPQRSRDHDLDDPDHFRRLYQELSPERIAERAGVSRNTVGYWRQKHGIETNRDHGLDDPDHFRRLYQELSPERIAERAGVSRSTVSYWKQVHGIETNRDHGLDDEDYFRRLYQDRGLSQREIAEETGASRGTVCYWMDKHDIEPRRHELDDESRLRELCVERGLSDRQVAQEVGCSRGSVRRYRDKYDIESSFSFDDRLDDPEFLREKYHDDGCTLAEIGDIVGCCATTVQDRFARFDISTRTCGGRRAS